MAFESLTDDKIAALLNCPKRLINPQAKSKKKDGHEQVNYKVEALDGTNYKFELYKRQNLRDGMEDDFSCGISWVALNGESLTLIRYNGQNHEHTNHLEKASLGLNCHIHIATEKYLKANRKAEGFAEVTDRYSTLEGALHCLVSDCKIKGIQTSPDATNQITLFEK